MDFIAWMHETDALAGPALRAAADAAAAHDMPACLLAARDAARIFLRRFLEVAGEREVPAGDGIGRLLDAAAGRDHHFRRLTTEASLLDREPDARATADDVLEALKEIRFMAMGRAGKACGFEVLPEEPSPVLRQLLTHCTPVDRACSIFQEGALLSFNECKRRGLITGQPIGVLHLNDPRRCTDFVMLGIPENKYCAGEKVAHSQRRGVLDEEMTDDYRPSVRLFFRKELVQSLPGFDDDGMHSFMVRGRLSLDHLLCAVFPNELARDDALGRVREAQRREWLAARCLVASPEWCASPQDYVRATNRMVLQLLSPKLDTDERRRCSDC